MVRDPSIVSPTLTGVFIGGGHNKHGTGLRCTLQKQCRPPLPDGDGGVTDRATRGACSAGSGIVRRTTSLGLRSPHDASITFRVCVGSNHSGMGKPINFRFVFPLHLQAMAREG